MSGSGGDGTGGGGGDAAAADASAAAAVATAIGNAANAYGYGNFGTGVTSDAFGQPSFGQTPGNAGLSGYYGVSTGPQGTVSATPSAPSPSNFGTPSGSTSNYGGVATTAAGSGGTFGGGGGLGGGGLGGGQYGGTPGPSAYGNTTNAYGSNVSAPAGGFGNSVTALNSQNQVALNQAAALRGTVSPGLQAALANGTAGQTYGLSAASVAELNHLLGIRGTTVGMGPGTPAGNPGGAANIGVQGLFGDVSPAEQQAVMNALVESQFGVSRFGPASTQANMGYPSAGPGHVGPGAANTAPFGHQAANAPSLAAQNISSPQGPPMGQLSYGQGGSSATVSPAQAAAIQASQGNSGTPTWMRNAPPIQGQGRY